MSTQALIDTPAVFSPLLEPARYKGAYGGRGSGKSYFFAGMAAELGYCREGVRGVCIREVQKDLKESAKLLIEDSIKRYGLGSRFQVTNSEIRSWGGGLIIFRGMNDYNADSIKSLEGFDWAWVEEAQTFTERSLELLRPTMRKPGSELWFSWNPRNAKDPVDAMLRGETPPDNATVVKANYTDNRFFPEVLEKERLYDELHNRSRYGHIWLGEYEPMAVGALWDRSNFHQNRRSEIPRLTRIVVGVDPAASAEKDSNETGIVTCAIGEDGRGYVLEDATLSAPPRQWAERAIAAYDAFDADAIIAEVNQGGDMVRETLHSVRPGVRVINVRASRGKHVRAEPISALYALNRISHVGAFPQLEDQLCLMTADGYQGNGSPDRADALVWAFTELFPKLTRRTIERGGHTVTRANSAYDVLHRLT